MLNNAVHFVFDSEHVDDIQTRLYGFCVTSQGIITKSDSLSDHDLTNTPGAWILVRRQDKNIEIIQDTIGCFGLFLFRDGDYWALSNSFNHLLDYVKQGHKVTLNTDYADAFLAKTLCIAVYKETIIKEIEWLDRRAHVSINPTSKTLSIQLRKLDEKTIPVDTQEGMSILDRWHDSWASFARQAAISWPGTIRADITGGLDTRMVLAPILSSGINLNHIEFRSHPNRKEDYQIASVIAEKFGFCLNVETSAQTPQTLSPIENWWERAFETIFFEKVVYLKSSSNTIAPKLSFTGNGGEILRDYQIDFDCAAFLQKRIRKNLRARGRKQEGHSFGAQEITSRSFQAIETMLVKTHAIEVGPLNGLQYDQETGNRSHFGMGAARACLSHYYALQPLLDPGLLKLKNPASGNHPLLISALILTRYHEQLAHFPIEGGRSIPKPTMQLAQELNERYPKESRENLGPIKQDSLPIWWQTLEAPTETLSPNCVPNLDLPVDKQLLKAWQSPTVQRIFHELYGKTTRYWADPNVNKYHPHANKYAAVAIAKAYEDARLGKNSCESFGKFIEHCCSEDCSIPVSKNILKRMFQAVRSSL